MSLFFLQVVRSVYTSKIVSSHRDLVALVFFGTEQSKNPRNSFKHVYVYHDLDEPGEMLHFSDSQNETYLRLPAVIDCFPL